MADVFLSYSRNDELLAKAVVDVLEAEGLEVFWDTTVEPGEQWRDVIGRALDSARCVVVLWSESSGESHWVREEAERAKKRGVFLPFRVGDAEPPFGFGEYQAASLKFQNGSLNRDSKAAVIAGVQSCLERGGAAPSGVATRVAARPGRVPRGALMIAIAAVVASIGLVSVWLMGDRSAPRAASDSLSANTPVESFSPPVPKDGNRASGLRYSTEPAAPVEVEIPVAEATGSDSVSLTHVQDLESANEGQCNEKNPPIRCLFDGT